MYQDITSQSEDERGRAPLKMGVLFPANHKEVQECTIRYSWLRLAPINMQESLSSNWVYFNYLD